MKKCLPFLFAIVAFACSSKNQDFTKIKVGMSSQDVIKIVGEPDKKANMFGVNQWYYNDDAHHIVIIENNAVTNITDSKKMTEDMNSS